MNFAYGVRGSQRIVGEEGGRGRRAAAEAEHGGENCRCNEPSKVPFGVIIHHVLFLIFSTSSGHTFQNNAVSPIIKQIPCHS